MPQASFAKRADDVVGALRKKYRTPEQALKALGLLAQDEAPEPEAAKPANSARNGAFARLVLRLATQLDPDDWRDMQPHIATLAGGSSEAEDEDEPTSPMEREMRQGASDEPPPFSGRPRTGGAMDSAAVRRFEEQYPGASNTRRDPRPQAAPHRPGRAPSKAAVDSFSEMYGRAAVDIKVA